MEEFMRSGYDGVVIHATLGKNSGLYDLRRSQMFHSIARTIISRKMNHERIGVKLRRSPHRCLLFDNPLEVPDKRRTASTFGPARVDNNVIGLSTDFEVIHGPIRTDLRRIVDHDFIVGILPLGRIWPLRAPIDDIPIWGWLDTKSHRIGLVPNDVHEKLAPGEVCMTHIELSISAGKIITEHPI